MKKKTNEKNKKKSEVTGLTHQIWNSCHESLITE
jgi:hypothetical protein